MYRFIDLGQLPNGSSTRPRAINNNGLVVGSTKTSTGDIHAFMWQADHMTDLGTLPGQSRSEAFAVNDSNNIVGVSYAASDHFHACLWSSRQLQDLGTSEESTMAHGINNANQIVGGFGNPIGSVWPCIWKNGERERLPVVSTKFAGEGRAFGINDKDEVVGFEGLVTFGIDDSSAIAWEGMTPRSIHPQSAIRSEAVVINNTGQIAGSTLNLPGGQAFRCSLANPSPQFVGAFQGYSGSRARGMNNRGDIVGLAYGPPGQLSHAFLWSEGSSRMIDLNNSISPNSGWTLTHAEDINDRGQIVGRGQHLGQERGWMLDPFTLQISNVPGSVVQILFGLVAGGGGVVLDPRGGVVPIDPPNPVWHSLSPSVQDILVSLALDHLASQMNNPETRMPIQRAAINAASIEIHELLQAFEGK